MLPALGAKRKRYGKIRYIHIGRNYLIAEIHISGNEISVFMQQPVIVRRTIAGYYSCCEIQTESDSINCEKSACSEKDVHRPHSRLKIGIEKLSGIFYSGRACRKLHP